MSIFSYVLIITISILHFYIMYLEMFSWTKTNTQKIFKTSKAFAEQTKVLAANQGLYNGFLATGLIISLFLSIVNTENIITAKIIALIFLSFILIAGIYGGLTSNKKIFYIQSIPAIITIISIYFK